jgi:hypothetical protein
MEVWADAELAAENVKEERTRDAKSLLEGVDLLFPLVELIV